MNARNCSNRSTTMFSHGLNQKPFDMDDREVVSFQTHSATIDLTPAEEVELFNKVLNFVKEFLEGGSLKRDLFLKLSKQEQQQQESKLKGMSFKKLNSFGSRICFDGQVVRNSELEPTDHNMNRRQSRTAAKKISIFLVQEEQSSGDESSDNFLSMNSVRTMRSIEIPALDMNIETIGAIYDSPQPFLINLSLCLFVRYCFSCKKSVKFADSAWVLCLSTILAYKLYYDEELEGLMQCFMEVMGVPRKDLIDLERCFLAAIDYHTVVRNYEYHYMLSKLISMDPKIAP